MAIAYQSFSSNGDRNAAPLTITKPTGLAEGDLMIAYLSCNNGSGSGSWTLPSGWTSITTGGNTGTWFAVFAKVATAGDVAAASFDFTGGGDSVGLLIRFTGTFGSTDCVHKAISDIGGITTTGVDPEIGGALVMFGSIATAATGAGVFSDYAVVTDNPTWTEIVDGRYNDLREIHYFAAWGLRSQTTATGNSSVTESAGGTNYGGVLLALVETTSANANHTILTSSSEIFATGISVGTTANHTLLEMDSDVSASSSRVTQGADQWTLSNKNTGSWTLDNKS